MVIMTSPITTELFEGIDFFVIDSNAAINNDESIKTDQKDSKNSTFMLCQLYIKKPIVEKATPMSQHQISPTQLTSQDKWNLLALMWKDGRH